MKHRVAAKVQSEVLRGRTYRRGTVIAANRRVDLHFNRSNQFWFDLMDAIGPIGRAKITARRDPARALEILMERDVKDWDGDDAAWGRVLKWVERNHLTGAV